MYVDDQKYKIGKKKYRRVLLRNSYRVKGKVKHDTIANLSQCSDEEIKAIKLALTHKGNLKQLASIKDDTKTKQGLAVGALWLLFQIAKRIGVVKALGNTRMAKLVLWLVIATLIAQGSRLSAVRTARRHAVCDVLGLEYFNEDHLYEAMDWLDENQARIERYLFKIHYKGRPHRLYLYDVTSSYLEGDQNELGEFGYNRDGKKGKKQIVIGLLTDEFGRPISVEVFEGNTQDIKTFKSQIEKLTTRFGIEEVTLVGDRGMVKSTQIADLAEHHFHYITAITKPQIEKLIREGTFQLGLFEEKLYEVEDGSIRYVLRRNPERVMEIEKSRLSKLESVKRLAREKSIYLQEHKRAKESVAVSKVVEKAKKCKIDGWIKVDAVDRKIEIRIDHEKKAEVSRLDGCYVIKTDLGKDKVSREEVHDRYKSLAEVEWAFRTMKTVFLEMRGIFVRKAHRTRAHVFIIMLAYLIEFELRKLWKEIDVTVEEGIDELADLCATQVIIKEVSCQTIPEPRELGSILLQKAEVTLPDAIPCRNVKVDTRKKLVSERKIPCEKMS